jgi:hypothetical protein
VNFAFSRLGATTSTEWFSRYGRLSASWAGIQLPRKTSIFLFCRDAKIMGIGRFTVVGA